jgi:predicted RNA methylase
MHNKLLEQKESLVRRFGPWTAHNMHLGNGVYTIAESMGRHAGLRRIVQVVQDIARRPVGGLRILDLACLEGLYAIEFALQGAAVVGIEAREQNLAKARFSKEILNLTNLDLVQDDVRNLSASKYGQFDVVICAGILYHLDEPDVFHFLERISEVCTHASIIDTHVSVAAKTKRCIYKGKEYFGSSFVEHRANSSPGEKAQQLWASLDNVNSFWITKPSLLNCLTHVGFTSVYECHNPSTIHDWSDRVTLVALKGARKLLVCSPPANSMADDEWPEQSVRRLYPAQRTGMLESVRALGGFIQGRAKRALRWLVGRSPRR